MSQCTEHVDRQSEASKTTCACPLRVRPGGHLDHVFEGVVARGRQLLLRALVVTVQFLEGVSVGTTLPPQLVETLVHSFQFHSHLATRHSYKKNVNSCTVSGFHNTSDNRRTWGRMRTVDRHFKMTDEPGDCLKNNF